MVGHSTGFVKDLIVEVKKRPALWDRKHKFYQKRDITRRMWLELSKKLQMSIPDIKSKWKTLRDNHRVEFRKTCSGWAHMNDLKFLDEQIGCKFKLENPSSPTCIPKEEKNEHELSIEAESVTSYAYNDVVAINPQEVLQIEENNCVGLDMKEEDMNDSDRLFLMSLLSDMKKLQEEKNRAIRIQFQQILYNALYT